MSINKLSHLKEGEKIYLEVTRIMAMGDDKNSVWFESNDDGFYINDDDTFYTLEELKQLEYRRQDIQDLKCKVMYGNKYSQSDSSYKCEKVQYKD